MRAMPRTRAESTFFDRPSLPNRGRIVPIFARLSEREKPPGVKLAALPNFAKLDAGRLLSLSKNQQRGRQQAINNAVVGDDVDLAGSQLRRGGRIDVGDGAEHLLVVGRGGRAAERQHAARVARSDRGAGQGGGEFFGIAVQRVGEGDFHRGEHRAVGVGDGGVRSRDGSRRSARRQASRVVGAGCRGGQVHRGGGVHLHDVGVLDRSRGEHHSQRDFRGDQPAFAEVVLGAGLAPRVARRWNRRRRFPWPCRRSCRRYRCRRCSWRAASLECGRRRRPGRRNCTRRRAAEGRRFPRHLGPFARIVLFEEPKNDAGQTDVRSAVGRGAQAVIVGVDIDEAGEAPARDAQRGRIGGRAVRRRTADGGGGREIDLAAACAGGCIPSAVGNRGRVGGRPARRVAQRGVLRQEQGRRRADGRDGRERRAVGRVFPGSAAGQTDDGDAAHDRARIGVGNAR